MEKIDFLATDGIILNGLLYKSENKTKDIILAVHGITGNCFKERDKIIADKANENNIDYFCFNNRGSDLAKYVKKNINGEEEKLLGGSSYEDVLESYEDIVGAILKIKELGYENIYLQGHSLGCTKIVYTYNELLEDEDNQDILSCIKGIILLSLIDIHTAVDVYLGENFNSYLKLAEEKMSEGKQYHLMPKEAFIHPISVKTFLRIARDNKDIDFARYGEDNNLEKLNNIQLPLFMRWGNQNEMIVQRADELIDIVSNAINNENKDIDYIDGADHGYTGKEDVLAEQIVNFIRKYKK